MGISNYRHQPFEKGRFYSTKAYGNNIFYVTDVTENSISVIGDFNRFEKVETFTFPCPPDLLSFMGAAIGPIDIRHEIEDRRRILGVLERKKLESDVARDMPANFGSIMNPA